ncbi:tetratricopeptide repeat protein [Calothrix sp. CCY 0018]|uniref:tetratricopeptide repeat protein n=1 Tax=Calothrix sp. CCY 0018 TaxID=3103864 RepID=UPI0039C73005
MNHNIIVISSLLLLQVSTFTIETVSASSPITQTSGIEQAKSPKLTGWLGELEQKAKQFTVRIDSNSNTNGSGIIIAKEGNTYTVLTSAHVVCEKQVKIYPNQPDQPCEDNKYEILAPDGKKYPVDKTSIKIEQGVDLAVVKFNSLQNYQIATIADYNPNEDDFTFTAGYPKLGDRSPWRFTSGLIFDKEKGLLNTNQSEFQNNDFGRLQIASSLKNGYELVYSNITYGGMSGGPVLDSLGRVIGIHGSSDAGDGVPIGYSLGIPISTFLGLVPRLGVKPQKLENTLPPQLNTQNKKLIEQAVLSTDVFGGNATDFQWLERGNQLFRLRRYQEAVKAFDEAIKQKSFVYLAYYGKGLALADNYKESAAALEQAVIGGESESFVPALHQLSVVYRKLNQPDKALVAINKAIQIKPQNPNLYNEKSEVLQRLKQYAQAKEAIDNAIKISPRAAFYSNRGVFHSNQENWKSALADYNKAIQINPNYFDAYFNRALVYSLQKQYELALADFKKAIQINPGNANAYYYRGIFYQAQNKDELALTDYSKVIEINPDYANAYYNKGLIYHQLQNKFDLAIDSYNKAIQLQPNNHEYYNYRGLVYIDQQKWDLALADYNKAIEINPEYASAYSLRGLVYMMKGNKQKAVEGLEKAAQLAKIQNNTRLYEMVMNHLQRIQKF